MPSASIRENSASPFDVVPPVLLVPPDYPIRSGSRTDAGLILDRELVRLAGMEARCRVVRARIARRLMKLRAWRPLGFVRLSDYARERLGCSPRALEEDARVLELLDALPSLAEGFDRGDLSWTQIRVLVRVATPHNEVWLARRAASLTTRELETFVRRLRAGNASGEVGWTSRRRAANRPVSSTLQNHRV